MIKLKELNPQPPKEEFRASSVRKNALNEIKAFAFYEAELLYKLIYGNTPNYEDEEELCICTGDLKRKIFIKVATDCSYNDTDEADFVCVEISKIIVSVDGTIIVRNEDGDEWDDSEISFDEIVNIVDALQEAYNAKIKE